ncbi:MAG TPA: DUF362 domain-containing protein [Halanaerobiales bacterium]|nr:DUF362 domain-containing protein [Halanaerobiales bacterium]
MNKNIVAVSKCEDYTKEKINKSLDLIFKKMGGIEKFINNGDTVVIKPNMLLGKTPDKVVTTHPVLIKEVINRLNKFDCRIIIGDSPGGPFNEIRLKNAYKKTGFYELAELENVELNYNTESTKVSFEDGFLVKSFEIVDFIKEADLVINMSKLKTHSFMRYTGSVKNLFGAIPGMIKAEYHLRMPEANNFALMLVDLARLISPQLNIMDAVYGMEGAGPSAGDKRNFGYLMASTSPFNLDLAGTYLFNMKHEDVPTVNQALQQGVTGGFAEVNTVGDKLIPAKNTKVPKINESDTRNINNLPPFIAKIISKLLKPRPVFNTDECVKCGDCAANCPADAIELNDYPEVDLNECIRCFCCQELCSYEAVNIKKPFLGKIFFN